MTQQQEAPRVRPRPVFRLAEVQRVERLTPSLVRVTLTGEALAGFTPHGPAEHLRLWFPIAGEKRPLVPEWGESGPIWPEGKERPPTRVYTPRRWDPELNELDIDIVLHSGEDGPGSRWAKGVKAGDEVVVSGPSGPYNVDATADWFVVAGDHAALPAVATVLETLPEGASATVLVELASAADELPLTSAANIEVTWLRGSEEEGATGRVLEAALRGLELPQGDGRIFVACEASVMRDIRRHLIFERGLSREAMHTHGYWKYGAANHPDHDIGQEI